MSATAKTGNYKLPIYQSGDIANYLLDWNGAMNKIDKSMNDNKMASDGLTSDFENIQTEFQQVSSKADAAERAASDALTASSQATTIANNAAVIAGDAQTDAHAALASLTNMNNYFMWSSLGSLTPGTDYIGHWTIQNTAFMYNAQLGIRFSKSAFDKMTAISGITSKPHLYALPSALSPADKTAWLKIDYNKALYENTNNRNYYYSYGYTLPIIPQETDVMLFTHGIYINASGDVFRAIQLIDTYDPTKNYVGYAETATLAIVLPLPEFTKASGGIVSTSPLIIDIDKYTDEDHNTLVHRLRI